MAKKFLHCRRVRANSDFMVLDARIGKSNFNEENNLIWYNFVKKMSNIIRRLGWILKCEVSILTVASWILEDDIASYK